MAYPTDPILKISTADHGWFTEHIIYTVYKKILPSHISKTVTHEVDKDFNFHFHFYILIII